MASKSHIAGSVWFRQVSLPISSTMPPHRVCPQGEG